MKRECLLDLGRRFYEWHKKGQVQFVCSTDGKNFDEEIERISKLIEYVQNKKDILRENYKYGILNPNIPVEHGK